MEHFGYAEQLYKLFRIKKNTAILDAFTDEGTKARLIDRFGDRKSLLEDKPCAYDEYGELVDLTDTGLDAEYDAEVLVTPEGQLRLI